MPRAAAGYTWVTIELPDALIARLRADAAADRRTLKAQVILTMEKALGDTPEPTQRVTPTPVTTFADWYQAYPVHKGRADAEKAYTAAVLAGTEPDVLLAAVERYKQDPQVTRGFIKNPGTWLRQKCWLDEPSPLPFPASGHQSFRNPDPSRYETEELRPR